MILAAITELKYIRNDTVHTVAYGRCATQQEFTGLKAGGRFPVVIAQDHNAAVNQLRANVAQYLTNEVYLTLNPVDFEFRYQYETITPEGNVWPTPRLAGRGWYNVAGDLVKK